MRKSIFKKWGTTLVLATQGLTQVPVHADVKPPVDETSAPYVSPYIDPVRKCITEGMVNPNGANYRYLYSKDCKVVFVLPPPVLPQIIRNQGVNLQACDDLETAQRMISQQYGLLDDLEKRIRKFETDFNEAKTKSEEDRILQKIEALTKRKNGYREALEQSLKFKKEHFGRVPGMISSVTMLGNVGADEINQIRAFNDANLNRRKEVQETTTDANGNKVTKTYEVTDRSALRPAPIEWSIYSFIYRQPKDDDYENPVISSNIPGLEHLEQNGSRTGVLHVRANDTVSGEMQMGLTFACDHTKFDDRGFRQLDESSDPIFTVNRTFHVQEMFSQGYTARLNVEKLVDDIVKYQSVNTEQGFRKSSVFGHTMKANIDQLVSFRWDSEFQDSSAPTFDKIHEIKKQVTAKFIDEYFEKLVQAKIISPVDGPEIDPVKGGYADEARVAGRCWSESDGGLGGLFGGRHTVCSDYVYTVKVWHDGVTNEEKRKSLTLDGETAEVMTVNTMVPFSFTTSFTKK